jgi:hypothetical protein
MARAVKGLFLSSPPRPDRLWGPPSLLSGELTGVLSLGAKQPGREADHSSQFSAEVRMHGAIPPLPNTPSWRGA